MRGPGQGFSHGRYSRPHFITAESRLGSGVVSEWHIRLSTSNPHSLQDPLQDLVKVAGSFVELEHGIHSRVAQHAPCRPYQLACPHMMTHARVKRQARPGRAGARAGGIAGDPGRAV